MFPSVVPGRERLHMYYASHGGKTICLATAPEATGPWGPLESNPVLSLRECTSVRDHLSSPETIIQDDGTFLLYYHGKILGEGHGQVTGVARSTDGLAFSEVRASLPVFAPPPPDYWACDCCCYTRVLRKGDEYHAFFTTELRSERETWSRTCLEHAVSADGLHWQREASGPLLVSRAVNGKMNRIRHCGACWLSEREVLLFYSVRYRNREPLKAVLLERKGRSFAVVQELGIVLEPELPWEGKDLRDPFPLVLGGQIWLYYVGGGEQGIGLASVELAEQ
jgi:hypothetical protein